VETDGWRVRKDGSRFWANVVVDAVRDDAGDLIGFAKITRDMTERRAIDEQLRQSQKMEAVGQLTNGVAHDFNNLLATIIPNLELAQSNIKDQCGLKYLENAMRAAERGAQLTNQLLAFSRRHEILTESIDVNQVVSEACEMLPRTIGPTIEIETALTVDAWWALTEPGQLELAILNLAINARDAMPAGGKLTIATRNTVRGSARGLDPGEYVMISVADSGFGMTEEVRSRAFEPFFTTKELHKGTGLGLSMVYGLAKQSGGTVTIESEIGSGTTVRIYLPRAPRRTSGSEEADERSQLDAGPPSRILVVDDNSAVRTITAIMLRIFGHDAIEAASGQEALDLLGQDSQFDLLIVDLAMPNMHGDEFATRARELIPDVPILFVTGYAEPGRVRQRPEGEILKKPFRRVQLAAKLRYILRVATRSRLNGERRH
jgi:signal transduction histidine kinase/CheY-like chemotaxis protein